jgi:deazaflavin-dependent oxidoreductase (nitroreductase family)
LWQSGTRANYAEIVAPKRNMFVELFWRVHPRLYKSTNGKLGGKLAGMPVLLLTTRGRKSGQPRERALTYVPSGGAFAVIASFLGEPRHPDWYLNLKADPQATVRCGAKSLAVRARDATGDERERLWREAVKMNADYEEYSRRTDRRIPVVVLEPRP